MPRRTIRRACESLPQISGTALERDLTRLLIEYDGLKTAWPRCGHGASAVNVVPC